MYRRIVMLALCYILAACAAEKPPRVVLVSTVAVEEPPEWRKSITPADDVRLERLRADWDKLHARLPTRVRYAELDGISSCSSITSPDSHPALLSNVASCSSIWIS